ncbi:MAG TPA: hypothetical protein VG498_12930 [Terriglobales bacterium]|nr:hypothetical protein [Terriglobales bacterium]
MKLKVQIFLFAIAVSWLITACHSRGIDVTIQNNAAVSLRNVEIDYPGAAFGVPVISPGGSYWYHIKPLDDGELTLGFELENGRNFKQKQAAVRKGEAGRLVIIVEQDSSNQFHTRIEMN